MFGKDKINDPFNTMNATVAPPDNRSAQPGIRNSQVEKIRGAHARVVGVSDLRDATRAQRANAAAKLQAAIQEATPEEVKEAARYTGFTAKFIN